MNTVAHDGRTTTYRVVEGPAGDRLYVHGSGGDHRVWAAQYGRGRGGVALDLSGHGDSDDVVDGDILRRYADDVVAVVRETGARVLVGNSLGGAVVLRVALDRLDPVALVLCGTGARLAVADDLLGLFATDFEAAIDHLHDPDRLFHDPDEPLVERSRATMRAAGRAVVERDFRACEVFDVRDRLDELSLPALAITGEHDRLTPPWLHEDLADALGGDCVLVDGAAHLSFLERPGAWNDAVDGFLADTGVE